MITNRDQNILNFLEDFHISTSNQIHRLFFNNTSYRYSRKRLQYLFNKLELIKQTRSTIDNCFAYYINKKPVQIHHDLLRTELYTCIKNQYHILEWNNETTIVNIRPDALCYINNNGITYPVFIEIHLNNKFNFDKYIDFTKANDIKAMFGLMPKVIIFTDRQINIPTNIGIKFKAIDIYNMNGLNTLFK